MLLRALGYGTMGEYEGKGWDINAVADALYHKVFEDTEASDFSQPATREETALYVFNAMFVELVGYDVDLNYYRGKGYDFAGSVYSMEKVEGLQVKENQATGADYTVIGEIDEVTGDNYAIETGLELIGHEVTLYYKTDSRDKDKDNNYFYEAYLVQDNSAIIPAASAYWADLYKAFIAISKANKTASLDIPVWDNYVYVSDADTMEKMTLSYELNGENGNTAAILKGDEVSYTSDIGEIIFDSEGAPLAYMVKSYTVDQVKKITEDGIVLKNDTFGFGTYDPEYAYEGIAKGDYVTVQPVGDICYLYPTSTQEIDVYERSSFVDFGPWGMYKYMWFNFYSVSTNGYSYNAVNVPNTDDAWAIAAGDKVLFYLDYYGAYFATEILERGTLKGVVLVNYAFMKTGDTDEYGDADDVVYVQCVDQEGKEVIYPLRSDFATSDADVAYPAVCAVYTNAKGEAILTPVGGQINKEDGKKSYLTSDADIYYISADTKFYYVNGIKGDMTVKSAASLASGAYPVYAYSTGSSGNYNVQTAWILGQSAPTTGGSYIYISESNKNNGGSMLVNEETTYYFTLYIDGVETRGAFISNDDLNAYHQATVGFYTYNVDENNVYDIEAVAAETSSMKVVTVTLEKGDIHDGKLYYEADGVTIDASVVNDGKPKTADGKKYLVIEDIEDIEAILDEGGTVTVDYLAVKRSGNWVPSGVIYVTDATEAAE